MVTFTRERLREMYQESVIKAEQQRQENIRSIVKKVAHEILAKNELGHTTHECVFSPESNISEIVQPLQQMFVDSVIEEFDDMDKSIRLKITWTIRPEVELT